MDKIKLYPVQPPRNGSFIFFDAGDDIELRFDTSFGYDVMKGDTKLMVSAFQEADSFLADRMYILEPTYFEVVSDEAPDEIPDEVWCRDPRLLMGWALRSWCDRGFDKSFFDEFNQLFNPLPSMEEARRFVEPNGLIREDALIASYKQKQPYNIEVPNPLNYVNVPPKFQALVEKYKAR